VAGLGRVIQDAYDLRLFNNTRQGGYVDVAPITEVKERDRRRSDEFNDARVKEVGKASRGYLDAKVRASRRH
jgi:hypothetical protein